MASLSTAPAEPWKPHGPCQSLAPAQPVSCLWSRSLSLWPALPCPATSSPQPRSSCVFPHPPFSSSSPLLLITHYLSLCFETASSRRLVASFLIIVRSLIPLYLFRASHIPVALLYPLTFRPPRAIFLQLSFDRASPLSLPPDNSLLQLLGSVCSQLPLCTVDS